MPGGRLGDAFSDGLLHIRDAAGLEQLHCGQVPTGGQLMQMTVNQSRHDRAPGQLDDLGVRPGHGGHLAVVTDGEETPVTDRHRFGNTPVAVNGNDFAAAQDDVGRLRLSVVDKACNEDDSGQ